MEEKAHRRTPRSALSQAVSEDMHTLKEHDFVRKRLRGKPRSQDHPSQQYWFQSPNEGSYFLLIAPGAHFRLLDLRLATQASTTEFSHCSTTGCGWESLPLKYARASSYSRSEAFIEASLAAKSYLNLNADGLGG